MNRHCSLVVIALIASLHLTGCGEAIQSEAAVAETTVKKSSESKVVAAAEKATAVKHSSESKSATKAVVEEDEEPDCE